MCTCTHFLIDKDVHVCYNIFIINNKPIERGNKDMRMERLSVTMPHSTVKAFRRFAQIHDLDLCIVAKKAVTEYCKQTPSAHELEKNKDEEQKRIFISMPDTAMRLLELWSTNTGIPKPRLIEWAIKKLTENQMEEEEQK